MGKRLSREKRAELIEQYMALPRSQKRAWIKERGLTFSQMSNWRKAYIFGDLAEGRIPRDTMPMELEMSARLADLQRRLGREMDARLAERKAHEEEVARLQAMNDALGKAIGLLHERNAKQEPTDES